jgi:ubiquinone/menaquinone biosynthesis C-methylase UbiE
VIDEPILRYYERGAEQNRLLSDGGNLELIRTRDLLERLLPPVPATVLDVGGGAGVYAAWLAERGYRVHLIDPVPLHVEQATATAAGLAHGFTAAIGDARHLGAPDESQDAVLLLGPLYHLTERADRLLALREARRVLRPGGVVLAVGISRFASLLDGVQRNMLANPAFPGFDEIVAHDLQTGQHRNPDPENQFGWFTTAFFHHPDVLAAEVIDAGFKLDGIYGVEGPAGLWSEAWADPGRRPSLVAAARAVEREPALLGVSSHLLAVGTEP